ncbi:MAG TPA: polysaccharide deacetylase family protein [Atribacteraceae bacterium]|nr:polysaccharide deacetylase family protein [Atribacteraceae bacterium]
MRRYSSAFGFILFFLGIILTDWWPGEPVRALVVDESKVYGYNRTRLIWNQARSRKMVTLTFDDGPNRQTDEILRILDRYRVRATFFLIGSQVSRHASLVSRIVQAGHDLGNHTYLHLCVSGATLEELERDIERAEKAIVNVSGRIPLYFRPPGGVITETVKEASGRRGYSIMLWDVDSRDWALRGESAVIVENVLQQTRPGSVILLHDLPQTVEALPLIIEGLLNQGYSIVPASELFRY